MTAHGETPPEPARGSSRRQLIFLGLAVMAATLLGGWLLNNDDAPQAAHQPELEKEKAARLVSLSPGVTQTVVALGAGKSLVGISDYCSDAGTKGTRRVGSAITPNYEKIAELGPSLILTSDVKGSQLTPLKKLAPTSTLPWLTLSEWTESITVLGQLIEKTTEAEALRDEVIKTLSVPRPEGGPRVLFALDYGGTGSNDVWFIRRNSIHGAVLRAAGAQNAVQEDVSGQPKLSPEELLRLDPDIILIQRTTEDASGEERAIKAFERFSPLRAVKNRAIGALSIEGSLTVGPGVLDLVPLVRAKIGELSPRTEK